MLKTIKYKVQSQILSIFGDIKIFPWPAWILYQPETYLVKGIQKRHAMKILKSGDIVMRKYVRYLDGYFIQGAYSHSGIYIGSGKVIHAIAEGVQIIDILDFLECDAFCIVRPNKGARRAVSFAKHQLNKPYDFNFDTDDTRFYCHELTAKAYEFLNPKLENIKIFGHPTKKWAYTCNSFLNNENMEVIYEYSINSAKNDKNVRKEVQKSFKKSIRRAREIKNNFVKVLDNQKE
jgi:hypothetical protein